MNRTRQAEEQTERRTERQLDATTFRRLIEEGQNLRRAFEADSAPMRVLTPDDMKIRSR